MNVGNCRSKEKNITLDNLKTRKDTFLVTVTQVPRNHVFH